jgi:hypothetical protein
MATDHEPRRIPLLTPTPAFVAMGAAAGILAGVFFLAFDVLASAAAQRPSLAPFYLYSSLVLGIDAARVEPALAVVVGGSLHLSVSALFGVAYALYYARLPIDARLSYINQAATGLIFGTIVWLLTFQLIARAVFPWFLETPQIMKWLLHSVCYGLPLALFLVHAEKRTLEPLVRQRLRPSL